MTHAHNPSVDSEMHELNAEADLLEQKTTVVSSGANGEDTKLQAHNSDPDAQAMVIESLRTQVQDLFSQVSQLNNKLVRSYDRVSDLEDELHVTSSNLRNTTLKVGQLELERTQHLSALSTGLLVEKSHVTAELTRLMEKATDEAARRGQAESARAEIEKDLDDLSAGLFDQANRMVAEARIGEARSARKLEETEAALRSAEEVVGALQSQMQQLESEKELADRRVEEMRVRMGKGKWVDRSLSSPHSSGPRFLSSHVPYHEFLIFVSHLRAIRPAAPQPPAMSTLLPLPLLARLVAEDSDPTVRLDLAPSLNWLSRRSVLAAIHSGQLTVEPMQFTTLLEELAPPNIPASSHHTHIVCALCGMPIYSSASDSPATTPTTPNPARPGSQSASWSTSLFKNVRAGDLTYFAGQGRNSSQFGTPSAEPPSQLYIFRLDATSSGLPVSLPMSQQPNSPTRQSIYPLCTTGWCLARLRTTCSLWAFVRTSIVEKIWEEPPIAAPNGIAKPLTNGVGAKHDGPNGVVGGDQKTTALQAPPRKAKIGLGSLWGSMQRSLSGTREPEKDVAKKEDTRPKLPPRDPSRKTLPPPPPSHPTVSHAPKGSVHRVPPPLKDAGSALPANNAPPPPLPKRNRQRSGTTIVRNPEQQPKVSGVANGDAKVAAETAPPQVTEPAADEPSAEPAEPAETPAAVETSAAAVDEPTTAEEAPEQSSVASPNETAPVPRPTLVAPSISQTTSNDSFSTPTEELAPELHSSNEATPPPQESSPAATEPAQEHASAAEPAAVPADGPPSRTGSPAPPPLPRRAAARARPSSTLVPQSTETESEPVKRDSIDESPSESAPQPEVTIATEQPASVSGDATPTAAPVEPAQAEETGTETETAPVNVTTTEPEQMTPAEETAVDAPVAPEVSEKKSEEPAPAPAPAAAEEPHIDGDAAPEPTVAESNSGESVTVTDSEPEKEKEAEKEEDNGQYVGDATWEERTYKELVRLREDMFWARIGAVVH